jgi:Mg-chelatase subunit ChlD
MEVSVGGGTNIARALKAARERVTVPSRTLVLVVSDFEEGGGVGELLAQVRALVESGVRTLGLAALDDRGAPRYAVNIAEQLVSAGMPVAALSPLALAEWLGAQVRG